MSSKPSTFSSSTDIVHFIAMPPEDAVHLWSGGLDAYGHAPQRMVSDGPGHPCRHCLGNIDAGDDLMVLAYCPFPDLQPYAETGPIFLHAQPCRRYEASEVLPPILNSPDHIVRGYCAENRIVYGSGAVTPTSSIIGRASELFERPEIDYIHIRSARNNCYQCRIERG